MHIPFDIEALERRQPLPGALVGDHDGAGILERLAAGDMIEMMVAVDQILDRGPGDLADFLEIGLRRLRPAVADRIGGDHPRRREHEHRLMVLIAEDNILGALDPGGREQRLGRRRSRCLGELNAGKAGRDAPNQKRDDRFLAHDALLPARLTPRTRRHSRNQSQGLALFEALNPGTPGCWKVDITQARFSCGMPTCNQQSRLVIDGVFEPAPADGVVFRAATGLDANNTIATVQACVRRQLLRVFVRRGLLPRDDAQAMAQWEHGGGFSVDGSVRIAAADRAGRERLLMGNFRGDP